MRRTSGPLSAVPVPAATAVLATIGCGVLLTGCGAPAGLGEGTPAPPATSQAQPKTLWPAWSPSSPSGSDAGTDPERAPDPLSDAPSVPPGGLAAMDQLDVLRADPHMARLTRRGAVDKPGTPGVRPAVLHDLTGDRRPELISAVDLESGRVVLAVYTVREGAIVPILCTSGLRPVVEAVGKDLVVRGATTDGAEQAVRYRWDGKRMITASEVRSFRTAVPEPAAPTAPDATGPTAPGAAGPTASPAPEPSPSHKAGPSSTPDAPPAPAGSPVGPGGAR